MHAYGSRRHAEIEARRQIRHNDNGSLTDLVKSSASTADAALSQTTNRARLGDLFGNQRAVACSRARAKTWRDSVRLLWAACNLHNLEGRSQLENKVSTR